MMSDRTFEALMSEHHAEIYRYVLRVTGRRQDADDLSQETFLRAFRAHCRLPADANARAWLFAIATNLTRNHFRSQKRRRLAYSAVVTETRETDEERPDGVTISREIGAAVDQVISGSHSDSDWPSSRGRFMDSTTMRSAGASSARRRPPGLTCSRPSARSAAPSRAAS